VFSIVEEVYFPQQLKFENFSMDEMIQQHVSKCINLVKSRPVHLPAGDSSVNIETYVSVLPSAS
jgi:hypothetical protein